MADDLPTGTVTFLFTDVEGSTKLLAELGEQAYAAALERHRDVVRSALAAHGGVEVDTQGDAFFCAFSSAREAVACAERVQSDQSFEPIRVRIGLHTGEALLAGDHYVGMDVHRAARIGACGHGGQVVVSPSTAALLQPGSVALKELGLHRLKDLSKPVLLYQLGDGEFAPLNTLYRTNLPVPATPFLGRETELRELQERASRPDVRLLTLTGPGGTGKTRVALQLAAELGDAFPDGVRWVPLAPLRDPGVVVSAVAQALEVKEEPGAPLSSAIAASIGARRVLLLLDNCEHVLETVSGVVSPVLETCPSVLVLATSREPVGVAAEHVYPVEPLLPADALSLFQARARAAGAAVDREDGREAIEELCARLDHLPLAVELAAARAAAIPPALLLERLASRIDVLKGPRDSEERQRTLSATIAWSHDLLEPPEQELFRRLSVFAGGAELEAVEEVCEADLEDVLSLVSKSLVRQTETRDGGARYWMLETIREFAGAELEKSGEAVTFRERHLDWFAESARTLSERLESPRSGPVLERLELDLENLRSAFRRAQEAATAAGEDASGPHAIAAVSLCSALAPLHMAHGRFAEAEETLRGALALGPHPLEAALLQSRLGRVVRHRERPGEGLAAHLQAERLLDALPERDEGWWRAWIWVKLEQAHHFYFQGDVSALEETIDQLKPELDARGTASQAVAFRHVLVQAAYRRERYVLSAETETLVREVYRLSLEHGDADAEFTLGFGLLWRGKLEDAADALESGLATARVHGDALIEMRCLVYGALANRRRGDVERVRVLQAELDALDDLLGYRGLVSANAAWLSYRDGDFEGARSLAERAFAAWTSQERARPSMFQWTARLPLAGVALAEGRADAALEQARLVLDASQQPLPDELAALLADAVEQQSASLLERALALARTTGHA